MVTGGSFPSLPWPVLAKLEGVAAMLPSLGDSAVNTKLILTLTYNLYNVKIKS